MLLARLSGWNPNRAPGAQLEPAPTQGCFDIRFPTYPQYGYTLMRSGDLKTWAAVTGTTLIGTGHEAAFTVSYKDAPMMFWQVVPAAP